MNHEDLKGRATKTSGKQRLQFNVTQELFDRASQLATYHGVTLARFAESILASAVAQGEQARALEEKKRGG